MSARTKTDSSAKLAALLAAKATNTVAPNRSVTVARAVDTFLERELPERTGRGGRPLAPGTVETYGYLSTVIIDELGKMRLASLTVEDVEAMLQRRQDMSAATLRKLRGVLQRVLAAAVRRHHVAHNVALQARLPRAAVKRAADRPARRALAPDDARTLLEALHGERNGAMFALSLRVGLRPGEASALWWDDLDGNVLRIRRGVRVVHGNPSVVEALKTEASRRAIELPTDLADMLGEHRRNQRVERLGAERWGDTRLMFASTNGRVLSPSNVRRQLAALCVRAGVPVVTPNELRHSCASLLSDLGVPNEQIADLLGHTTTRMVELTYRHRLRPVVDIAARADWAASSSR